MHFVVTFGNVTNGWSSTAAYPNFGDDYWFRATANFGGIWWNSSKEAVYELLHVDANGDTHHRRHHVQDDASQPTSFPDSVVDCFWSLTVYGKPDYMLVPNPAARYNVSNRSDLAFDDGRIADPDLRPRAARRHPGEQLAAHARRQAFTADLRLYLPSDAVRDGAWVPPALVPAD